MKVDFLDKKTVRVFIEYEEDLIDLFKVINPGDVISGYDYRVIEISDKKERKKVWIKIRVEDIKFSEYSDSLRVSGKIIEASEEVQGHFHTFDIRVGSEIVLFKEKGFKRFELEELSKKRRRKKIYIVSLDNNSIAVAKINKGLEVLLDEDINVPKDHPERDSIIKNLYKKAVDVLRDAEVIVIVGPVFYPEEFKKYLLEKVMDKEVLDFRISIGGISGIYEFLNRTEYLEVLRGLEIAEINKTIDDFIFSITKGKACFGLEEVLERSEYCNLEYVLISYEWFKKIKSNKEILEKVIKLIENLDKCNVNLHFVRKENKNFELIDRFGVVGKVRY